MYWLTQLQIIGYLPVISEYVVPASFFESVKEQCCVLDSWLGDDHDSIYFWFVVFCLSGAFFVPASNDL